VLVLQYQHKDEAVRPALLSTLFSAYGFSAVKKLSLQQWYNEMLMAIRQPDTHPSPELPSPLLSSG
jgi:hypothetical protein